MFNTPIKVILFSIMSSLTFTACSTLSTQSRLPLKQLQHVQNIEAFPDTKTNIATLNQDKDHCIIQFTGYLDSGQSTETWQFKAHQLERAFSETYQYNIHNPTITMSQKPEIDRKTRTLTVFDIQNPQVRNNFDKLKIYFNQTALDQCY